MNKNIIIAILVVVIVAILGIFLFSHPATNDGKLNTQINFLSEDTLQNGETIIFELKDSSGAAIVGEPINISYVANGVPEKYSILTDTEGKGYLVLSGEEPGSYEVTVTYGGNDKCNPCSAQKTITIVEETSSDEETEPVEQEETESNSTANTVMYNEASSSDSTSEDSSSSSSGSNAAEDPTKEYVSPLYYDEELGVYYDDFGTIHGGDMDGNEIQLLRDLHENPNTDEEGNPQWGNQTAEG